MHWFHDSVALTLLASQQEEGPELNQPTGWSPSVWSLFSPKTLMIQVYYVVIYSRLAVGVNQSMNGCLHLSVRTPIDWQPVHDVLTAGIGSRNPTALYWISEQRWMGMDLFLIKYIY